MSEYQPANLENLFVKRAGRRMRVASCDPTGGNNDNVLIPSGETYLFADLQGPGIVTHFFCTIGNPNKRRPECGIGTEEFNVRKVVLNVYWDDETEPSIQAPLGDFFGMGHGITKELCQCSPADHTGGRPRLQLLVSDAVPQARPLHREERMLQPAALLFLCGLRAGRFPAGKHAVLPRALEPRMPDGRHSLLGALPPYGMDHGRRAGQASLRRGQLRSAGRRGQRPVCRLQHQHP